MSVQMNENHGNELPLPSEAQIETTTGIVAAGSILGAVAASTCCIIPLVLFSLGISGAWIGRLTSLAPYQPIFMAVTIAFLGYGYWLVYRSTANACENGQVCAHPLPRRIVRLSLWVSTGLITLAITWPYVISRLLG